MSEEVAGQMELPLDAETAAQEPTPQEQAAQISEMTPDQVRHMLIERRESQRALNQSKLQELATMQLQPEPLGLIALRLNTFIEFALEDPGVRLAFDAFFEDRLTPILDKMIEEAKASQLVVPTAQAGSGLYVPGQ